MILTTAMKVNIIISEAIIMPKEEKRVPVHWLDGTTEELTLSEALEKLEIQKAEILKQRAKLSNEKDSKQKP